MRKGLSGITSTPCRGILSAKALERRYCVLHDQLIVVYFWRDFCMLRLRALALVLILPLALLSELSAYAQKNSKTPKEESCSVSGIVVKMADSAPLRKARVVLRSVDDAKRTMVSV